MPNHVHFVCVPRLSGGLSRGFNTLHMRYAQYFHRKKGLTGHLWRGRFQSCLLDEPSCYEEIRFIENNPVRVGIVERAEEYLWSSARARALGEFGLTLHCDRFLCGKDTDWNAYLEGDADKAILTRIRSRIKTGRPAGEFSFVRQIEQILGRRLEPLPRGRPKKCR